MNKYTKEQKEFLINNNYMKTAKELAEMFNKKFEMNLTPQNIKTFRGNQLADLKKVMFHLIKEQKV